MDWYLKVMQQYFNFSGRANRKEFWLFTLFNLAITFALTLFDLFFQIYVFTTIFYIYALIVFIPSLAVLLRRLHDVGKTSRYFFLIAFPIIGWLWLLVLLCLKGEPETNMWGENLNEASNDHLIDQIGKE